MNQVLSQSEVDALLAAVADGALDEEMEEEGKAAEQATPAEEKWSAIPQQARTYDLTSHERVFRGKMPMLDTIHEKFCRDFGGTLSLDLGRLSESEPSGIKLTNFQEFLNGLAVPTCLSLFKIDPLPGNGVVVVDTAFVFTLVDIFCGGTGSSRYRIEGRDFSSIEMGIVRRIVKKALAELASAWTPVYPVEVEFQRIEINPQFISIAHPTEVVIIMESQVDVEGAKGKMQIVIPYATIEPIKERLSQSNVSERGEMGKAWKDEMRHHVVDSDVEVKAVLGTALMTIRDLVRMRAGEIIALERFADEAIDLMVAGVQKYKVESGIVRGYKAVQVIERVTL